MYESGLRDVDRKVGPKAPAVSHRDVRTRRQPAVAREASATYEARGTLRAGMDLIEAGLELLGQADLEAESDHDVRGAAIHLVRLASGLAGQQLRTLEAVDRRRLYHHDGAVTTASWYRARTRLSHGEASRQTNAAARLRQLERLRTALEDGDITLAHVTAVTDAAVPQRVESFVDCEEALLDLAMDESPWAVRKAVRMIAEQVDRDGADDPEPIEDTGPDPRRQLFLHRGIDGLWTLQAILDTVTGEMLAALLDAFETPDPADTPQRMQRVPAQRRVDALGVMLRQLLSHPKLPTIAGARPHVLLTMDIATLLGRDDEAVRPPRLRYGGEITPLLARELALAAKLTVVLTMGPWRVVNVGRTQRSLPSWLRAVLDLIHRQCRGPDCDRRITWSEAHHQQPWTKGGETDFNAMPPLCKAHHQMVTIDGWDVQFDPDTGICTWLGPEGQVIEVPPVTP